VCDPTWHVSSRRGEGLLQTAMHRLPASLPELGRSIRTWDQRDETATAARADQRHGLQIARRAHRLLFGANISAIDRLTESTSYVALEEDTRSVIALPSLTHPLRLRVGS